VLFRSRMHADEDVSRPLGVRCSDCRRVARNGAGAREVGAGVGG